MPKLQKRIAVFVYALLSCFCLVAPLVFGGAGFSANADAGAEHEVKSVSADAGAELEIKSVSADVVAPKDYVSLPDVRDFAVYEGRGFFSVPNYGVVVFDLEDKSSAQVLPYTDGIIGALSVLDSVLYCLDTSKNILLAYDVYDILNISLLASTSSSILDGTYLGEGLVSLDACKSGDNTYIYILSRGIIQYIRADITRTLSNGQAEASAVLSVPYALKSYNYSNPKDINVRAVNGQLRLSLLADSDYSQNKQTLYLLDFSAPSSLEAIPFKDVLKENSEQIRAFSTGDGQSFMCVLSNGLACIDENNFLKSMYLYNDTDRAGVGNLLLNPSSVFADGAQIYVLDNVDGKNSLKRLKYDSSGLNFDKNIFSTSGNYSDLRLSPRSAVNGTDNIYMVDYTSGRLSVLTQSDALGGTDGLTRPTKIDLTGGGRLFVSDNMNRLTVFDTELNKLSSTSDFSVIGDLTVSGDDTLYVSDTGRKRIYSSLDGVLFEAVANDVEVYKLASSARLDAVFGLDESRRVLTLQKGAQPSYMTFAPSIPDYIISNNAFVGEVRDIAVDNDKNLYALVNSGILRFAYGESGSYESVRLYKLNTKPLETADYFVSFSISRTASQHVYYGDILLCDRDGGSLRRISASDLDVRVQDFLEIDDPVVWNAGDRYGDLSGLQVRACSFDTYLYSAPNMRYIHTSLKKDQKVIVLKYDIDESEFFCFAVLETRIDGEMSFTSGYLLKTALTDPFSFNRYSYINAKVLNANTSIYRYPSVFAPKITSNGEEVRLDKNYETRIRDFAYPFLDYDLKEWLAIEFNGGVAFVSASNVNGVFYILDAPDMRTNARLVSNNVDKIPVYILNGQEYQLIEDITIPKNSRVALFERFDSKSEYTRILYTDSNGSLDCYVETKYVSPDGLTSAQITAIIILFSILIPSAVIIILVLKRNAKQKKEE